MSDPRTTSGLANAVNTGDGPVVPGAPWPPAPASPGRSRPLLTWALAVGWSLCFHLRAAEANAPEPAPNPLKLGLDGARRLAFQRNWDLLAVTADVDIAAAQKIVARQFLNPVAALAVNKISVDPAHGSSTASGNGLTERSYDSIVAVGQLLEIGGKRSARKASAEAGWAGAQARFADARRQLDLGVTRAYVAVLTDEEATRILRDSASSLRKEAGIAEARLKAGDISASDKSQIEIAAERLELEARHAESEAASARIAVETLLGEREPKGTFVPADSLEMLVTASSVSAGEPTAAIASRPDVRAAEAEAQRARSELDLQKALRVPDPTLQFQYEHEPPDQPHTLGLGVSFPLPLWNRNRGNIAAADAARQQADRKATKIAAQAAAEVAVARREYESALARREEYARNIVPKSSSIRETVTFAYQKGGASLLDLLSAERNDNEVRLGAAQAAAEVIVTRAALAAALNENPDPSKPKPRP